MITAEINLTLVLRGPFLTKSSAIGAPGVDAPLARDADGRFFVPGSLVKGKLRDAWRELLSVAGSASQPEIDSLLGRDPVDGDWGRYPALLRFANFRAPLGVSKRKLRTSERIEIDRERRAVRKGFIQFIEAPFLANEMVEFSGLVKFRCRDAARATQIHKFVASGLAWVDSFGADRSVGYGELLEVRSSLAIAANMNIGDPAMPQGDRFALTLQPLEPFCVTRHRPSNNEFDSDCSIPGAVIKGALAAMINETQGSRSGAPITIQTDTSRRELCQHFHLLRITHALPAAPGKPRPSPPPLSLAVYKEAKQDRYRDLALRPAPAIDFGMAPTFAVDWKPTQFFHTAAAYGWPDLNQELRVRTAIDHETRCAADKKLFAYRSIVPGENVWHAEVDLSFVPEPDRLAVRTQLAATLGGSLSAIGKTKATARVTFAPSPRVAELVPEGSGKNMWRVLLVTPALLSDPRDLRPSQDADAGTISRDVQFAAYQKVWHGLSNGLLQVVRYFHDQALGGGVFLEGRFQKGSAQYWPWLLTEPGSVFVLQTVGDPVAAQNLLTGWQTSGLPLPGWVDELYGRDGLPGSHWKLCPFIPANGYGEIACNVSLPSDLKDKPVL